MNLWFLIVSIVLVMHCTHFNACGISCLVVSRVNLGFVHILLYARLVARLKSVINVIDIAIESKNLLSLLDIPYSPTLIVFILLLSQDVLKMDLLLASFFNLLQKSSFFRFAFTFHELYDLFVGWNLGHDGLFGGIIGYHAVLGSRSMLFIISIDIWYTLGFHLLVIVLLQAGG